MVNETMVGSFTSISYYIFNISRRIWATDDMHLS